MGSLLSARRPQRQQWNEIALLTHLTVQLDQPQKMQPQAALGAYKLQQGHAPSIRVLVAALRASKVKGPQGQIDDDAHQSQDEDATDTDQG